METSINPKHFLDLEVGDTIAYPSGEVVGVVMPIQSGIGRFRLARKENQIVNEQQSCNVGFIMKPNYFLFRFHIFPVDLEELCRVEKGLRPDLTQYIGDHVSSAIFPELSVLDLYNDSDFETDLYGNILEICFWLRSDNVLSYFGIEVTTELFNAIKSLTKFATIGVLT